MAIRYVAVICNAAKPAGATRVSSSRTPADARTSYARRSPLPPHRTFTPPKEQRHETDRVVHLCCIAVVPRAGRGAERAPRLRIAGPGRSQAAARSGPRGAGALWRLGVHCEIKNAWPAGPDGCDREAEC